MNPYRLRKVNEDDLMLLFDWANDPLVRQNAYHTEPIELEGHRGWFADKLADENCFMYILTDDAGENQYGQVRAELKENRFEIDYSIAKEYRGQGLAKVMLQLLEGVMHECSGEVVLQEEEGYLVENCLTKEPSAEKQMQESERIYLYAEVKKENPASAKVFESLGYEKEEKDTIFIYTKQIR